jgi:two-component system response regulator FixJ
MTTDPLVHIIDDDEALRESLSFMLDAASMRVQTHESAVAFLAALEGLEPGCIISDIRMPEMSGLDLARELKARNIEMPIIAITGHGDVPLAVEAMKAGVVDFLEKPFSEEALLGALSSAMSVTGPQEERAEKQRLRTILEGLSPREQEVLQGIIDGKMNKNIAYELGISARTVEVYRANVMSKSGARGLSELVRMVMLARS